MAYLLKNGATSNWFRFKLFKTSTGKGFTGLTSASAGLIISTAANNEATATAYTQAGGTIESIAVLGTFAAPTATKCRFKEYDSVNHPGIYEFQFADARLAVANAKSLMVSVSGVSDLSESDYEIQLPAIDLQDTVRMGLTALPNANAAAANGLPVLGTNATAISFTGGMTISNSGGDALTVSSSGGNGKGVVVSGNGSGDGVKITAGATGRGIYALGGATSGAGLRAEGQGAGASGIHGLGFGALGVGMRMEGGTTGAGLKVLGGTVSGNGIEVTTTSGDGLSLVPTAGSGIVATGDGTSKHGAIITGGTGGTSDGVKAVAGTGGVPIRGDITGNVTGNLSGSVGSVTGAVGSVTGAVGSVTGAVGSVAGNVGGNVAGSVGSLTTNNDKTGYALSATGSAALTEGYATDGSAATLPQLLYMIWSLLAERSISSTTLTAKKLDGSTSAMTFTLDSATAPTSQTRAS